MKNKKMLAKFYIWNKITLLFIVFFLSTVLLQNRAFAVSVDIISEYEYWNSGLAGTSQGLMIGIGGSHDITSRFSIGGNISTGKFKTDAQAKTDTKRTDFDLVTSYRLYSTIPIYLGYQQRKLNVKNQDDDSRSFEDIQHAIGFGFKKYMPIKRKWLVFGGMTVNAILATSSFKNKPSEQGKGYSGTLHAGALYSISKIFSLGFSVKYRSTAVNYSGDAGQWSHNSLTMGLSASRAWR